MSLFLARPSLITGQEVKNKIATGQAGASNHVFLCLVPNFTNSQFSTTKLIFIAHS